MEGDRRCTNRYCRPAKFLSTPSGWRATSAKWGNAKAVDKFLSTPSGWRATPANSRGGVQRPISIHALRVEGDVYNLYWDGDVANFYPRPPGGGRPLYYLSNMLDMTISIHALRVEGDHLPLSFLHTVLYFYPRPPGWRATTVGRIACAFEQFLSTPSGWRATSSRVLCSQVHFISIHALRVEGDPPGAAGGSASKRGFLSTPSGWRATLHQTQKPHEV